LPDLEQAIRVASSAAELAVYRNGAPTTLNEHGRDKKRRSYLPAVEPLEGRRLARGSTSDLSGLAVAHESPTDPVALTEPPVSGKAAVAALSEARRGPARADAGLHRRGLAQLSCYLGRAWSRAGISPQRQDDCIQELYLTLLEGWGPDRFQRLVGDIDRLGIRRVLRRETADGPDFFRAIDRVKVRARRERSCLSLDDADAVAAPRREDLAMQQRADLNEAVAQELGPRDAALIDAILAGETPAEIAARWGMAAKTVSNEKTRVLHKLRDRLLENRRSP
jgi:RNA polymerase sigma factor (sigma-70 family)